MEALRRRNGLSTPELLVVLLFLTALLYQLRPVHMGLAALYENGSLLLAPSAEKAYWYGSKHFDSVQYPDQYDIRRAEHLFESALDMDPQYPHAHHQLGRVAFLRGEFDTALWHLQRELELNPEPPPSTHYMRGLVLGFMGQYAEAASDFELFLTARPGTWAALNDYAWVLLKDGRFVEAAAAAENGLEHMPDSPWLLNTSAIAHYETGELAVAFERAQAAASATAAVTEEEWLRAYPGNDPKVAEDGVAALHQSALDNMHIIRQALAAEAVQ